MPTSAPGSSAARARRRSRAAPLHAVACRRARGFTLIELLVVVAIIGISVAIVSLALRDSAQGQLEREGARLSALLETARAEARSSALPARWQPLRDDSGDHFRFDGMPTTRHLPTRWLDERVVAQVLGATAVTLGPEPILPPQRIRLRLDDQVLEIASDGLSPFVVGSAVAEGG